MQHQDQQVVPQKMGIEKQPTRGELERKTHALEDALRLFLAWANISDESSLQARQVRDTARAALEL